MKDKYELGIIYGDTGKLEDELVTLGCTRIESKKEFYKWVFENCEDFDEEYKIFIYQSKNYLFVIGR